MEAMTDEELQAIKARYAAVTDESDHLALIDDATALLVEVERLQTENHKLQEWILALEDIIRRERARRA
jgi:hypothetical protein